MEKMVCRVLDQKFAIRQVLSGDWKYNHQQLSSADLGSVEALTKQKKEASQQQADQASYKFSILFHMERYERMPKLEADSNPLI